MKISLLQSGGSCYTFASAPDALRPFICSAAPTYHSSLFSAESSQSSNWKNKNLPSPPPRAFFFSFKTLFFFYISIFISPSTKHKCDILAHAVTALLRDHYLAFFYFFFPPLLRLIKHVGRKLFPINEISE